MFCLFFCSPLDKAPLNKPGPTEILEKTDTAEPNLQPTDLRLHARTDNLNYFECVATDKENSSVRLDIIAGWLRQKCSLRHVNFYCFTKKLCFIFLFFFSDKNDRNKHFLKNSSPVQIMENGNFSPTDSINLSRQPSVPTKNKKALEPPLSNIQNSSNGEY